MLVSSRSQFIRLLILASVFLYSSRVWPLSQEVFPVSDAMRVRVDFWKKVYTEITSAEGYLHDEGDTSIIYQKMDIAGFSRKAKIHEVRNKKREISDQLLSLAKKLLKKETLSASDEALLRITKTSDPRVLKELSLGIRFQQGLKDRYYQGLMNSYLYIDQIRKLTKEMQVPEEVAYLPHVESSFNYQAYSKVGAAGIWQFMRSTARIYGLKMNYVFDERRDPILAARAAIRLLRDNFNKLGTWPLALTAYNHGPNSIERAIRNTGSRDINVIIDNYEGRRFGFASKNFYATFIAAAEISEAPSNYFPDFQKPQPVQSVQVKLPRDLSLSQIAEITGIEEGSLRDYNLAIRPVAFKSRIVLPKNATINLPIGYESKLEEIVVALSNKKSKIKLDKVAVVKVESEKPSPPIPMTLLPTPNPTNSPAPQQPAEQVAVADGSIFGKIQAFLGLRADANTAPEDTSRSESGSLAGPKLDSEDLRPKKVSSNLYEVHVQAEETLGHLAEWAHASVARVKIANGARRLNSVQVGQRIRLPIKDSHSEEFLSKRMEYHLAIEEDFYLNYKITGVDSYRVKNGDTVDGIVRELDVPYWLIRRYQGSDFQDRIIPGQILKIPQVESLKASS